MFKQISFNHNDPKFVSLLFFLFFLQAYRLEPLVNPFYAQVKPVKVSSASSKISQEMVDLAEGPRSEKAKENKQSNKSWWASQLQNVGQSLLTLTTGKKTSTAADGDRTQAPEKVLDSDKSFHPDGECGTSDNGHP